MNNIDIWTKILENIKSNTSEIIFETWFKDTSLSLQNNEATIICPRGFMQIKHLEDNYLSLIKNNFKNILNKDMNITFSNKTNNNRDIDIEKNESDGYYFDSNLKPEYTFSNFIVGNSNKLAYESALHVAKNPGETYNPLFIYGSSGLGKTHLMHAIGNYISQNSHKKVLYITCEKFIDDFVGMSRSKSQGNNFNYINFFKKKYRDIDVLIIDDIQSLETTKTTQEEFFNTFNSLHSEKKQIIISSDSSPKDLSRLEEHLRTRFAWGLVADIDPPEYELKIRIIKSKLNGEQLNLFTDEAIEYIAGNVSSNVRSLEGSINRTAFYYFQFTDKNEHKKIDLDVTRNALGNYVNKGMMDKNDINKIQKKVASYFKISISDLKSKKRNKNFLLPRQIATYLCCKYTEENLSKIGIEFSQTHSTVLNSKAKIEKMLKTRSDVKKIITDLKKEL